MTFVAARGVQKSLQVSGLILGLAAILGLLHCGRFSAYQYDVLNQEEILPSLIKNVLQGNKKWNHSKALFELISGPV
jgi:hypothetical protein